MGSLHVPQQLDPVTGFGHSIAKFNVFDAGPFEFSTERIHFQEHIAANGPTAGPERRCVLRPCLVSPVVQQVPVLGQESWVGGFGVIAAKNSSGFRVGHQGIHADRDGVRMQHHIRIREKHDLAACGRNAPAPGYAGPSPGLQRYQACAVPLSRCSSHAIGGRIIHHDAFNVGPIGTIHSSQAAVKVMTRIESRYYHGHPGQRID